MKELVPESRLIDTETGEIIGYMLQAGLRRVALTLDKIKELKLDCATYIEFLELNTVEVCSYNKKYALLENVLYTIEELKLLPFRQQGNKVIIWGNCFRASNLVSLDDEIALKYALNIKDEESCILG